MSTKARELAELSRTIIDTSDATAITINANEEVTLADDLFLADGKKAVFGDGLDLQIYHDGGASYIQDSGTGALYIQGDAGVNIRNAAGTENKAVFASDGAVTLYHNNAEKFATTSTGIGVTGLLSTTGSIRAAGDAVPTTGSGVELVFSSNIGNITSYDRSNSAYRHLNINGSSLDFKISNSNALSIDSSSNATFTGTIASGDITVNQNITSSTGNPLVLTGAGGANIELYSNGNAYFDATQLHLRGTNASGGGALAIAGTTVIDSARNVFGVNGSFTGKVNIGAGTIGTRSTSLSVYNNDDSSPIAARSDKATVFAVLPWSNAVTYLSRGTYYDDGAWIHASDTDYNALFAFSGGTGGRWYASSGGIANWNVAIDVQLWNNTGQWTSSVNTLSSVQAGFYKVGSTTIIDASGNLTNIGTITAGLTKLTPSGYTNSTANLAALNIGRAGNGETRAIDMWGSWLAGENKSITANHGSLSTNIVGQINFAHKPTSNTGGSSLRFGKLYHGGDTNVYTMELHSESTSLAYLSMNAGMVQIGQDSTYANYGVIGFGSRSNGGNRVFGHNSTGDGLYLASATGRGIYFRVNGSSANSWSIDPSGNLNAGEGVGTTVIDPSRNVFSTRGKFTTAIHHGATGYWKSRDNGGGAQYVLEYSTSDTLSDANIKWRVFNSGVTDQVGALRINGTTVIDGSRNLTNIGTISSGAITSTGTHTLTHSANIAAQTNMQLGLRDANSVNMRANFMVQDNLNSGRGGLAIQATESGVTNDRDLYLQPAGGRVGILTAAPQFALDVVGTTRIQGDLGLHAGTEVAAPTHFENLGITSTTGSNAGWTITTNQGTFNTYGAIDVAGIRNGHVYKFAFSGNFSAQVWYQFAKRSELASYGPSTGSGSEDGFMMYFRVYSSPFLCGLGEYSASRLTNMCWVSNVHSNSNQEQHFIFGPALGHAPNAGQTFPISNTGNNPYMYPFEMRIHHKFAVNDHPNSDQTFEIKFPSALTGLNPAAAGRQLIIYAYIG